MVRGVAEVSEKLKEANGRELDGCFGDFAGIALLKVSEDEIEVGLHFFQPEAFLVVIVIAALFPAGEVGTAHGKAVFAKFCDDCVVGQTILEHAVNGIAEMLRETSDFAFSAVGGLMFGTSIWVHKTMFFRLFWCGEG